MKRFASFLLIALVLLSTIAVLVSCAPAAAPLKDPIKIDTGLISGTVVGANQDIHVYKGIPFAAPPVGDLRWKPPQPAAAWQGVKDCTKYGNGPMGFYSKTFTSIQPTSEDCLYLNVFTPAKTASDKLPVMVWIYGGAFRFGEGSNPGYEGIDIVKHGVILVTFNYRVGPIGFLAHPLLTKESEHNSSSNYGLLDQIAALQWVQKNIAAFGGDANRVTIFGQSAGATSVICLMASPLTTGLFQRAISESMYESGAWTGLKEDKYGQQSQEKMGLQLAKDLGCDTAADPIACMRAKSAQEIMDAGKPPTDVLVAGYRYEPCVDGWVLPDLPLNIFQAGKEQHVPLLIGSLSDEWALFQLLAKPTVESYTNYVNKTFGDNAQQVLTTYPPGTTDKELLKSDKQVLTAITFTCPARSYASAMSKVNQPAYLYQFTRVPPGAKPFGAFHALEISYVFGTWIPIYPPLKPEVYFNDTDKAVSKTVISYWTNFAANGNPNGEGLTAWPVYSANTGQYLELGDTAQVKTITDTQTCDFFMNTIKNNRGQ
jgi:para-nitrobenzyl esterase